MTADPRDTYSDDVLAVLITGPEGADALRAALDGAELRTPAFRSAAGPVALFVDPDGEVREDVPGLAMIQEWDPLPAVMGWLQGSDVVPLAPLPAAFLAPGAAVVDASLMADLPEMPTGPRSAGEAGIERVEATASGDIIRVPATAADVPVDLPTPGGRLTAAQASIEPPEHADDPSAATQESAATAVLPLTKQPPRDEPKHHAGDQERHGMPAVPNRRSGQGGDRGKTEVVPVDLPARPTPGTATSWRLSGGRLVVVAAPVDPAAVPTTQQAEAAAALLRALNGRNAASLDEWRAECRSTWPHLKPGPLRTAFNRCRRILEERGAIVVKGGTVRVSDPRCASSVGCGSAHHVVDAAHPEPDVSRFPGIKGVMRRIVSAVWPARRAS